MKKVLTLLAIFAMVGLVSCKKDPAQATITASDVTVEEGSTVKINASTNSSATITYASDNTAVATVAADGTVTGVKAGSANISIKVAAVKTKKLHTLHSLTARFTQIPTSFMYTLSGILMLSLQKRE